MNLAPIIIFVYNRLDDIQTTIEALQKNKNAQISNIYIYSDAPKTNIDNIKVNQVRNYIKSIQGFKNITIIERKTNYGLAKNIIEGISDVINKYGKVIVLEDDLLTSNNFICYMNEALKFYENDQKIFSVSGFTLPLKSLENYNYDSYLTFRPSSWGWATWKNRWEGIDWNLEDFDDFIKNKREKKIFNRGGIDMTRMLQDFKKGKNNSWAIRWSYAMYKKEMFSIYPKVSKVQNIGFGVNATHCKGINIYKTKLDTSNIYKFCFTQEKFPNKILSKEFRYNYSYINKLIKKILGVLKK